LGFINACGLGLIGRDDDLGELDQFMAGGGR
jgi:hypothetical protein